MRSLIDIIWGNKIYESDNYYDNLLSKYSDFSEYYHLADSLSTLDCRIPTTETKYYPKLNISLKSCLADNGKPAIVLKTKKCKDVILLMYRKTIDGFKVKIEFHFFKEVLFFSQYTFPYASKLNRSEIKNKMTLAYLNTEQFDTEKEIIKFGTDSAIIITDSLELQLKYINLKSDFLKEIHKLNNVMHYNNIDERKMLEHNSFLSI